MNRAVNYKKNISFMISDETLEMVDAIAERYKSNRSEVIRFIISDFARNIPNSHVQYYFAMLTKKTKAWLKRIRAEESEGL